MESVLGWIELAFKLGKNHKHSFAEIERHFELLEAVKHEMNSLKLLIQSYQDAGDPPITAVHQAQENLFGVTLMVKFRTRDLIISTLRSCIESANDIQFKTDREENEYYLEILCQTCKLIHESDCFERFEVPVFYLNELSLAIENCKSRLIPEF